MVKRKTKSGTELAAPAVQTARQRAEPAVRALRQFRLVFNAVKTHFQQVEKKAGVGGAQLWALSIIHSSAGIGVNDLARAMDVHQSTASNLVRALVERELIGTAKDGTDRRAVQLRILPAGSRVLRRAPGPFAGVLPQALASLDAATLARLDEDLAKLITALGADARAANIPLGQA
jgi:DNA-binding MarR family transcriptional regulator